jgi:hypothetical protein
VQCTAAVNRPGYVATQHEFVNQLRKCGIFVLQCTRTDQVRIDAEALGLGGLSFWRLEISFRSPQTTPYFTIACARLPVLESPESTAGRRNQTRGVAETGLLDQQVARDGRQQRPGASVIAMAGRLL